MSPSPAIARSAVTSPPRHHLRVGILQGRRLVEERVFRAAAPITLGPSARDTFIVPADLSPRSWRLFEQKRGRLVLRLAPAMSARLAARDEVSTFDAAPAEAVRVVVLPDGARGKVSLGDTTILFQCVRPPTAQPRPRLPASVRRHVLAELDTTFAAILALTFVLHVVMIVYLRQVDWPRRPNLEEVPDRFVHEAARHRLAPPAPPAASPPAPSRAPRPAVTAAGRPRPTTAPSPAPKAQPSAAERHVALEKQVQSTGLIRLLTTRAEGTSTATDLLAAGAPDQAVEAAFKGLTGLAVAQDDSLRNLPRVASGAGRVASPADLRGARIASADVGPAAERNVRSSLRVEPLVVEGGHVDAEAIAREIRGRRRAVAACYERALKQQPTLAGKLVVRFSLSAAGTVGAVDIDEDTLGAPDVAACVRALALRWRFPALADGAAELTFPFVFQPGS